METNREIPKFTEKDKVEATFFNFDENKECVGILREIQEGSYGPQYLIELPTKEEVIVGTYGVLTSKIRKDHVGRWVKIVYLGIVESGSKKKYKNFELYTKDMS